MIPGEYKVLAGGIEINANRPTVELIITNTGDRPIQVGSHYHFYETNKLLSFNREHAFGKRLNIPAGTAVRFEPGEEKPVQLVQIGGTQEVYGLNGLTNGSVIGGAR
jgi:urease subunit beta